MNNWDDDGQTTTGTMLSDVLFNPGMIFFMLFLMVLVFVNPPKKQTQAEAVVKMPGNIMVWIRWPDYADVDVDLWARAPGDQPVGYSNRAGNTFNLLRDDLGNSRDTTKLNYEVIFGRDMPNGQYTVNVHLFRNGSQLTEVLVEADVFISYGSRADSIAKKKVILTQVGQEITVANFVLENGKLVGKPDNAYTPLRAAVGGPQ